ncbi:N-6 DNA methylase [Sulfuricurvum kujiense DSM 16994]|uniref:site-specific DNA-methyltransferase (adenine-specific) n=1 Tax=Sulfuricurvum kujiense (strain ATCC BAA-921 / DSM 16994 / JCM 11577 / YK-1) TaxID=709032 RepID=E4U2B3_SULKY|nr:class I SAM-dependent DNA methyltransferase [Sulfuricurvum kujiense]ADR33563.1 N-6 DNA methylase [Sulfuricurvum kujiense DSM 16994]
MESKINRITDILRRDDGISGAMHYTEQISWILFLKFLNDLEDSKADEALLIGKDYNYILDDKFKWSNWAVPKVNGKIDLINAKSGADLLDFVNKELFSYLKGFKNITEDPKSIKYKIGAIFEYLDNRIANGHTIREILDIIDELDFHNQSDLFQLSIIYEKLLKDMGSDGGNSGEFYTPRPLIKVMTDVVNPQVGQTIYDPAVGSCGFLIEAYNHIRYLDAKENKQRDISVNQLKFLSEDTFFGNEKTPLSYVMGVMNMILHGIESPNISKTNTLTKDIRGLEEKDRYDIILANPPFGGKEKEQIQQNFPIKSNATELLFLQHMMNSLKVNGRCGVVIPEGVLFQTNNAFQAVKQELLERFNVHTILSLPSGVFLPYSGVKTNVIFFDRNGSTSDIFYYEVNPLSKLTKNKPITYDHFTEFLAVWKERKITDNSWIVNINDIKDFDISAKNPNRNETIDHKSPIELVENIKLNNEEINDLMNEIEAILIGKDINE